MYWLFAGTYPYQSGGICDLQGVFEDVETAMTAVDCDQFDWAHICMVSDAELRIKKVWSDEVDDDLRLVWKDELTPYMQMLIQKING